MGAYGFSFPNIVKPKKASKKVYTKSELIAMNKAEQVKILKSLGVSKIPRREADRVKKILELM